jgi:outer membrane scaffolding protein for murein synthesis (MipA/OmpV family)
VRALALLLCLISYSALAETWIVGTVASYHYSGDKNYEQQNFGIGVEHSLSGSVRSAAGYYRNSNRRDSLYVGLAWSPLQYGIAEGKLKLGFAALLVSGYETVKDQDLVKAAFPVVSWEGKRFGINIPVIPATNKNAGAIGLQLKVRW